MAIDQTALRNGRAPLSPRNATAELGSSGLHRWGGTIHEEFLPELRGLRGVRVYEEMRRNDPVIGSVLRATKATVRGVSWQAEPASEDPAAQEWADFVNGAMDDMSHTWSDLIGEALTVMPFGWAWHETVYKIRAGEDADPPSRFNDGKVGWRKIPLRKQDSLAEWVFDEGGGIQGMVQVAQPSFKRVFLPINKAVLFRLDYEANNPEGSSMLRESYKPWYAKKNLEEIEGIGIERDLTGLLVLTLPANASQEDHANARDILERHKSDEQAGIKVQRGASEREDWGVELLNSPGSKGFDVDKVIRRYAGEIATAFLAQFIRLGQEGRTGSYALSRDQKDFFYLAIQAILDILEETMNRFLLGPLMRLNGVPRELWPHIAHGRIAPRDMQPLIEALKVLVETGLLGPVDQGLVQFLRSEIDLPPAPEEEPIEGALSERSEPRRWYRLAEEDLTGWVWP